ncbi:MAG: DUF3575 domain-containing protein [Bacteroidales bacterium]|nr:DUF3575 domain-containing protein [Candidatus Cacconaster merdequi]
MNTHRIALLLTLSLSLCWTVQAQTMRTDTIKVTIPFRKGVSSLDMDYNGTASILDGFLSSLYFLGKDSTSVLRSINIVTAASPEGSRDRNIILSQDRGQSIREFLSEKTSLNPAQIVVDSRGENWEGLLEKIDHCSEPWREEVAGIIRDYLSVGSEELSDVCKKELMAVDGGRAWQWMDDKVFPDLRSAGGVIQVVTIPVREKRDTVVVFHEEVVVKKDTVFIEKEAETNLDTLPVRKAPQERIPVLAFRSNLLLPAMNVGVEVPLSNRMSIGADWYYPWALRQWMNGWFPSQQNCVQALAGSLELRWWLGQAHSAADGDPLFRLCGHSIGAVVTGGYYDMEYDWKGEQGEFLALGVDYMYALPLGKGGVHFEFNLGAGYAVNLYRNYDVRYEGGHLIGSRPKDMRHLPVPLRARISLVVPIMKKVQ